MLKTALAISPTNENLKQSGQRTQVEDQDEKKPTQKSCKGQKGQKWLSPKNESVPKKQRPPELRTSTLVNLVRFLPPTLRKPLPN